MPELTDQQMLAGLTADLDRDWERAKDWIRETDDPEILLVVKRIYDQLEQEADPLTSVIARFARLGFAEAFLRVTREEDGEPPR